MKRYASVIGVLPGKIEEYKKLHAAVWPDALKMIVACHIQNYSIYLKQLDDGRHYLFSYLEYVGQDFKTDMATMAADPLTQDWWAVCMNCLFPIEQRGSNERWADMEEVFHMD